MRWTIRWAALIKDHGEFRWFEVSNFCYEVCECRLHKDIRRYVTGCFIILKSLTSASLGSAAKSVSSRSLTASMDASIIDLASLSMAANSVSVTSSTLAISASTSS